MKKRFENMTFLSASNDETMLKLSISSKLLCCVFIVLNICLSLVLN